jgi:hypothetical protein
MADRNVTTNETFAEFRNTMNGTMTDIGDISTLGNSFGGGTPTDLVEACNNAPSSSFAVAMCVALG